MLKLQNVQLPVPLRRKLFSGIVFAHIPFPEFRLMGFK
jgi:hypothetical protein